MKRFQSFVLFAVLIMAATLAFAATPMKVYRFRAGEPVKVDLNKGINIGSIIGSAAKSADTWLFDDGAWPRGETILLLVHGMPIDGGPNRDGLLAAAKYFGKPRQVDGLSIPGYDVIYAVEYPKKHHILETAAALADIVNAHCPEGQKIDIFAHSLGGVICRPAIELSQDRLGTTPMTDHIAHLIMAGTPNGGFDGAEIEAFKFIHGAWPEVLDLNTVGDFITKTLNPPDKKKLPIDYYQVIGTCSWKPKLYKQGIKRAADSLAGEHDGLVPVVSASYDLTRFCRSFKTAQFSLNHDAIKEQPEVFAQIDRWMVEDKWLAEQNNNLGPAGGGAAQMPDFKTGFPIPLGRNLQEAQKMIGRIPDRSERHESYWGDRKSLVWIYYHIPGEYTLQLEFECPKDVPTVVTYGAYSSDWSPKQLPVIEVVPKELLARKPDVIGHYKESPERTEIIITLWFIDGTTYALFSTDTQKRLCEIKKEMTATGDVMVKKCLTPAGRDLTGHNITRKLIFYDKLDNYKDGDGYYVINGVTVVPFDE